MEIPKFQSLNELYEWIDGEAKRRAKICFKVDRFLEKSGKKVSNKEISEATKLDEKDVEYVLEFLQNRKAENESKITDSNQRLFSAKEDRIDVLERKVKQLEDKFEKLKKILSN